MTRVFVFPGQGSQFPGMGKDLAEAFASAREVFEEVDESLGQPLSRLMFGGSEAELNLTENTQPALMAVSMAVVRTLEHLGGFSLAQKGIYAAGHSLGEYSALCAMGAFTLSDTARLLRQRGQAMQAAVPVGVGAMAAILGLDYDQVAVIAKEASNSKICTAANDNANGQVVVSGHREAVEKAVALAGERGAKRSVMLPVSAPFHCPLMEPAAKVMAEALGKVDIQPPALPVICNVTAAPTRDPAVIRDLLVQQVTGMVRWRESVLEMRRLGVEEVVELGAGKVLSGLVRRIDRDLKTAAAGTPQEIEDLLKAIA